MMPRTAFITLLAVLTLLPTIASAADWSEAKELRQRRRGVIVSYRAKLEGRWLVVEAVHGDGWHTYSMDNLERARKATGEDVPDTELPTVIMVSGGLQLAGPWHQSKPKDLTNKEIQWYTWGFEGKVYFAVPIKRTTGDTADITISAQACNESACSMVNDLRITLDLPDELEDLPPDALIETLIVSTNPEK
jgi:DsbC/DsbD-like thiol-disulfide interchange protein